MAHLLSENRVLQFTALEKGCPRFHEIREKQSSKSGLQTPQPIQITHTPINWQCLRLTWLQPTHESADDWAWEVEYNAANDFSQQALINILTKSLF